MKGKIKLLMVDDSNEILNRLKEMLGQEDKIESIQGVNTIQEAMHAMLYSEINTVTLDIGLPNGNGFNFLMWLKEKYPQVRVLILSNQTHKFYRKIADKLGVDHFLDKSFEFDQILHSILNPGKKAGV